MTWTRLDEHIFEHPKLLGVSVPAQMLYVRALVYCNRMLTDGRVSEAAAQLLMQGMEHVAMKATADRLFEDYQTPTLVDLAGELVRARLWHKQSGQGSGWNVHAFLEYQPSKGAVMDLRLKRQRAGQLGGLRSANTQAFAQASARGGAQAKPKPVPFRSVPSPTSENKESLDHHQETSTTHGEPNGSLQLVGGELVNGHTDGPQRIFDAWRTSTGHRRTVFDEKRRRRVRDRLKDGWSVDDLVLVVTVGWSNDPWPERKLQNDLEQLLRDNAHVEKFYKLATDGPPVIDSPKSSLERSTEALLRSAAEHRAAGN